jgi:hypothetical protein
MRKRSIVTGAAAAALLAGAGYGAVTWYRYGRVRRGPAGGGLLDRFMPEFDVRERHQTRVAAPAAVTFAAARELALHRSPLIRGLFRARQLLMGGTAAAEAGPAVPFLDEVVALGWRVLAEEPEREIVVGAATQPWVADVVFRGVSPGEFAAFAEPNYVKIAWTIGVTPLDAELSLLRTETRVVATDEGARARFRPYWTLASPGILLIRREMLRLVRREAEARAGSRR